METEGSNWIPICCPACHGDVPQERHVVFRECQVSLAEPEFLHTLPFDAHHWVLGQSPTPLAVVVSGRETGRISGTICHRLRQRRAQHRNDAVVSIAHVWFSFLFGVVEAGRQPQLDRSATSLRSLIETGALVEGNSVMRNIPAFGASLGALDRNTRPADSRLAASQPCAILFPLGSLRTSGFLAARVSVLLLCALGRVMWAWCLPFLQVCPGERCRTCEDGYTRMWASVFVRGVWLEETVRADGRAI